MARHTYTVDFSGNVQQPISFTSRRSARIFAETLASAGKKAHLAKNGEVIETFPKPETWQKMLRPACDCCDKPAIWSHSEGGLRCGKCPRP